MGRLALRVSASALLIAWIGWALWPTAATELSPAAEPNGSLDTVDEEQTGPLQLLQPAGRAELTEIAPPARLEAGPQDVPAAPPGAKPSFEYGSHSVVYEFLVHDAAGRPAPGARVLLYCGRQYRSSTEAKTGADGRVRMPVPFSDLQEPAIVHASSSASGLASDRVLLPAPHENGTRVITLAAGAFLDVRVLEEAGGQVVPEAGLWAWLDADRRMSWGRRETDDQGRLRLGPLPAGAVHWSLSPPAGEHRQRGSVELVPSEVRELELYLAGDGLALALEGRFLDADGQVRTEDSMFSIKGMADVDAPHLWVGASMTDGRPVHPDSLGRFRVYRKPCEELIVLLNVGPTGHRYAPESRTVPFGTRGLELRPVETFERTRSTFHITSAATGEPLDGAGVRLFLDEPMREQESMLVERQGPGLFAIPHRAWPNLRYVVWHKGYQHHFGVLPASIGSPIEVVLEPGIHSPVQVLDATTLAPIQGARFRNSSGEFIATTNSSGETTHEGPPAAGRLSVAADGFGSRRWYASWYTHKLYLNPKPAGSAR